MNPKETKQLLHDMRSSINVLGNFINDFDSADEIEMEHRHTAQKSLEKLKAAVEEISQMAQKI